MDLQQLENELEMAYALWENASQEYRELAEEARIYEYNLKKDISNAYAEGRITGKNETERKAAEFTMFGEGFEGLEIAKENEAEAYMEKELSEIKVKLLRDILRVKELAQISKE
jgi:hypothetical protein